MIIKIHLFLAFLLMSNSTFACSAPPPESRELPIEAAFRSDHAGIVSFYKYEKVSGRIIFRGKVKRVLWGDKLPLQEVSFVWGENEQYYEKVINISHSSSVFWLGKSSNLGYASDCQLLPRIRLGVDYIFLKSSPLSKYSLEIFSGNEDPWYELVIRTGSRIKRP